MSQTQSSWSPSRFLKTAAFFDAIPFLSCLRRLFSSANLPRPLPTPQPASHSGVVLVAGATGGVGKRVVQQLQAQGYPVRALVRDRQRAQEILGADLIEQIEIIDADITLPATLTPAVVDNVRAVICCTGVRVQPVEGDTPDRAKYYQGIRFYQPEIVGDTPENVDYKGIQNLLQAVAPSLQAHTNAEKMLFDFRDSRLCVGDLWGALDDVVMGGVSQSGIQQGNGAAIFTGNVSTANSGGFASVRTRNLDPALNLAGYEGIKLRVKGDGNRYKFLLRCDSGWDSVAYSHSFDTIADQWQEVAVPFAATIPVFRAKSVPDATIAPSHIHSLQLMLSKFEYDKALNPHFTPGAFRLEVETIAAYGGQLPQLVLVSSAGVTRPGRPDLNLDEEPPAVRMNDQLGGILTWKLRGEDWVRQSGIPYTIIRPCALTEAAGGAPLCFEQGDTIRGQVSRNDIAALCVAALSQPQACNITMEVKNADLPGNQDWGRLFAQLQPDRL